MKIHILQHVLFEGPAGIATWAETKGHGMTKTSFFQGESPPPVDSFDWLIVMGGPMNIYEEAIYPWLAEEKRFLTETIAVGKVVLGICLGAQLIADVLGAKVFKNSDKEIGWYPVKLMEEATGTPAFKGFPREFIAFHWHGDTFPLPPGSKKIAMSVGCENQAFSFKEKVIGLQFHLESTGESVDALIKNCGDELVPGRFIQSEQEISNGRHNIPEMNRLMALLLDNLQLAFGD